MIIHKIEDLLGLKNRDLNTVVYVQIFLDKTVLIGLETEKGIQKMILGQNIQDAINNSRLDVKFCDFM